MLSAVPPCGVVYSVGYIIPLIHSQKKKKERKEKKKEKKIHGDGVKMFSGNLCNLLAGVPAMDLKICLRAYKTVPLHI